MSAQKGEPKRRSSKGEVAGGTAPTVRVLSKNSSGFQDTRAASLVVFSAVADTPVSGGCPEWNGMLSGEWIGFICR